MNSAQSPVVGPARVDEYDRQKLERLFLIINKRFFQSRIDAELRWEIPKGTVSVFRGTASLTLTEEHPLHIRFREAESLIRKERLQDATVPLQQCADAGHPESEMLLSHLLKKLGDNRWVYYSRAYNRHFESVRSVPAACYYPDSRVIALHPYLLERNAPQLVLKYLLYHECCHQLIPSDCESPHPPEFMEWELRAPFRKRALEWLEKEGFPTLPRDSHG